MSDRTPSGEAHPSAVSHIDTMPQAVIAHARDLEAGDSILPHSHAKAQFIYASQGVMTVTTDSGAFFVPPQFAVWMPAGVVHRIHARGPVAMRTLYVRRDAIVGLPDDVCVLEVSRLLRELVLTAVSYSEAYAPDGPEDRLMQVVLDQLRQQRTAPLALAMPQDKRIRKVAEAMLSDPADDRGLEDWSRFAGASPRTLARLFQSETGMTFRAWRQQLRLQRALEMLTEGQAVTSVALDLGYDSPSAFIAMFRRALGASPTRYLPQTEN
jgi:AraC-like DNA-binding protein/mannose-6-phosphate isomerase-like protein (cupin superfamily)